MDNLYRFDNAIGSATNFSLVLPHLVPALAYGGWDPVPPQLVEAFSAARCAECARSWTATVVDVVGLLCVECGLQHDPLALTDYGGVKWTPLYGSYTGDLQPFSDYSPRPMPRGKFYALPSCVNPKSARWEQWFDSEGKRKGDLLSRNALSSRTAASSDVEWDEPSSGINPATFRSAKDYDIWKQENGY